MISIELLFRFIPETCFLPPAVVLNLFGWMFLSMICIETFVAQYQWSKGEIDNEG